MLDGRVGQHEGDRPFAAGLPDRSESHIGLVSEEEGMLFDAATGEYREFKL